MVDVTKTYYMTRAALFEKKEKNEAMKIVAYRRKDYIMLHMLIVMLAITAAYALLVGAVVFCILMANDEIVLKVGQMAALILGAVLIYAILLIVYYVISHQYYGKKHVRARKVIGEYLDILDALKEYSSSEAETEKEEG